jgi:transcriptional regulator with XRE-family HTH domain
MACKVGAMTNDHPLRKWRHRNSVTLRALAARLKDDTGQPLASHVTLSRIENGQQHPSFLLLMAVHAVTDGAVTAEDFARWARGEVASAEVPADA